MSLLQEVLSSVQAVTLDNVNKDLPGLNKNTVRVKKDMINYIQKVYQRYEMRPEKLTAMRTRIDKLLTDRDTVKSNVSDLLKRDIINTKTEVSNIQNQIKSINSSLLLCDRLTHINDGLQEVAQLRNEKSYVEAIEKCLVLDAALNEIPLEEKFNGISQFAKDVGFTKNEIAIVLQDIVRQHFKIEQKVDGKTIVSTITIQKENDEIKTALKALYIYQKEVWPLDIIIKFLWEHMYTAIVLYDGHLECQAGDGSVICKLTVNTEQKGGFSDVFQRLVSLSEVLYTEFNYELKADFMTIEYIGEQIREKLSELIIKSCLHDMLTPTTEGPQFDEIKSHTDILQTKLIKTGIFTAETTSIMEYANNLDTLFINKKCKTYKDFATGLMKKDLHDVTTVGTKVDPTQLATIDFPQCSVSRSVEEILTLVENIMIKASKSPEISAGRFYQTAKQILHVYAPIVMEHHRKLLKTIPQQVAIFYNNCMYIVHCLNQRKWSAIHKLISKVVGTVGEQFDYERAALQDAANTLFQQYVDEQVAQIEGTVGGSGIATSGEKLEAGAEKSVRQCLRQMELLKTVWQKILNYYDYNRVIGALLNALCAALVSSVLVIEDISTDVAEQLHDILKLVQTRGPKLFSEPKEINMYVESWHKLSELVFVLQANLLGIRDRWAEGKGPLALHFTSEEMKHLIKALFQNTDNRAMVLAQI